MRNAALDVLGGFAEKDRDGVTGLVKAALRDSDPEVRARAQALLAKLLEPILPGNPIPTDGPALERATEALRKAHDETGAAQKGLAARMTELGRAVAQPATNEEAIANVEKLVAATEETARALVELRRRIESDSAEAERAAGSAPEGDAVAKLDDARALVAETRGWLDEADETADNAARKGRRYLATETGDAETYIAAAESALVAGKLAEARKDLDTAAKLLRGAGKDATVLRYSYGQIFDKQAGREKNQAARLKLLHQAKDAFEDFAAHGSGPRASAARARAAELAEEIKELETL